MRSTTRRLGFAGLVATLVAPCAALAQPAQSPCATAMTPGRAAPLAVSQAMLDAARPRPGALQLGAFDIVLVAGAGLAANPAALAAFERAAQRWEAVIGDPIVVTIDADFANIGSASIIGQASSVILQGPFDTIRDALVADAALDGDDGIAASMPTAAQFSALLPAGFSLDGNLVATKANLKALGFPGLDAAFGASDASITFNSAFSFDLDDSDGITPGTVDFETVAAHEIGHALGFTSEVDTIDGVVPGAVSLGTLDLYRFANGTPNDPAIAADFTAFARSAQPGVDEIFDDLDMEARFSTGLLGGDGRQASHWKDDVLTGTFVGLMDPTLASGTVEPITAADERALDLIGYDIGPSAVCGDGVVGIGEECDDGNTVAGDCCSPVCLFEPSTTVCRPSADPCDLAETCSGSGAACPADTGHPDTDGDGVCDGLDDCVVVANPGQANADGDALGDACDPCTDVAASAGSGTKLTIGRILPPGNDDTLVLKGSLASVPSSPAIDPVAKGLRVLVADGTGASVVDVTVPPGAYDAGTRTGWLANVAGTAWTFKTKSATLANGIQKASLKAIPSIPGAYKFGVKGKGGTYPVNAASLPLTATLVIDTPQAATGQCGEATFPAAPPARPSCVASGAGDTIKCR